MSYMFCECSKLWKLNLSNFNTAKVTDMQHMFHLCSDLVLLDLSSFNTANVVNMYQMFCLCCHGSNDTHLYLGSNFVIPSGTDTGYMFYGFAADIDVSPRVHIHCTVATRDRIRAIMGDSDYSMYDYIVI